MGADVWGLVIVLALILIVIIVVVVIIYNVYRKLTRKVKSVSKMMFDTEDIVEGISDIKQSELLSDDTPKSIKGMEKLEAPRIHKDFPELSLEDLKSRNISAVYEFYNALKNQNLDIFKQEENLNSMLSSMIDKNRVNSIVIDEVSVHNQCVSRYIKTASTATITFHVAFEYIQKDKTNINGRKIQKTALTKWVYRLDDDNFSDTSSTVTKSCPNCGAPIVGDGNSICEYCSASIKVDYNRTWNFTSMVIE